MLPGAFELKKSDLFQIEKENTIYQTVVNVGLLNQYLEYDNSDYHHDETGIIPILKIIQPVTICKPYLYFTPLFHPPLGVVQKGKRIVSLTYKPLGS